MYKKNKFIIIVLMFFELVYLLYSYIHLKGIWSNCSTYLFNRNNSFLRFIIKKYKNSQYQGNNC